MSPMLRGLTFNGLQKNPVHSIYCANHELLDYISTKWHIPKEDDIDTRYIQRHRVQKSGFSVRALYRLVCTFPEAVHAEPTDKSAWWSTFTHKTTGKFFGFDDIKGRVALRIRMEEFYLRDDQRKNKDRGSVWRAMEALKKSESYEEISRPYSEVLPRELVDRLRAPETEDPELLKELRQFVEDKVFSGTKDASIMLIHSVHINIDSVHVS
ncbi:hypothetical protein EMPS_04208 [Entomortierella parvispora]|uniref:Uncharacterized protein n=1 Tax=Entomortierella parvispora TaxID=205924 RepID=A0A9P3H874_9FUNG|nr:hypothetical protein EMPS_04208 [Entomortierella parvispora]